MIEWKLVFVTWIDLKKAFDKDWTDALLVKLQRCGMADNMLRWFRSYVRSRRAKVTVNGQVRRYCCNMGRHRGVCFPPTHFLIFINGLIHWTLCSDK